MKNVMLRFGIVLFVMIGISCDRDTDDIPEGETTISVANAIVEAKVDTNVAIVSDVVTQGFETAESTNKVATYRFLPDCAVVTIRYTDTTKEVTVDFGTEGCEVRSGHFLTGKVLLSYAIDFEDAEVVISYSFEDFFIDEVQVVGTKVVTRTRGSLTENPMYVMSLDVRLIFADGAEASRTGTATREWIEGVYNGNWEDNVFEITGAWQTTFVNGAVHSTTIITPLRREASCRFLVSGVVEIVRTRFRGTLDYGDGQCDAKAIFTNSEGLTREIVL